jgi:Cu+-exporting ATPase
MPHLYFESAAVVITLVRLGKWLEARAKRRTLMALDACARCAPRPPRVRRDGTEQSVPAGRGAVGDAVVVRPGERLPTDGIMLEGRSHLDESLLTGESLPVAREPGDRGDRRRHQRRGPAGGAHHRGGRRDAARRASCAWSRSRAGEEGADPADGRPGGAVFVPVVVVAALLTLLGWGLLPATGPGR